MSLVVLRRVSSWEEAVVMISALRSGGISADLFDTLGQTRWELQTALGGFRVMVRVDDVEEARGALEARTHVAYDDEEPIRPSVLRRAHKLVAVILIAFIG